MARYYTDHSAVRVLVNLSYLMATYDDVAIDPFREKVLYNGHEYDWSKLDDGDTDAVQEYNDLVTGQRVAAQLQIDEATQAALNYKEL